MSCKSAIYTVSTAVQAVVAGNSLSLGSTIRRFGCSTTLSGNAIALNAPGYYDVDVSVTAIPTAAGTVSVTLFQLERRKPAEPERDPVSGWCGRAWRGCFCYYHCRDE